MTLDRAGKTRTGTVELRMFSSVGHLGQFLDTRKPSESPGRQIPIFQIKKVRLSMTCRNSHMLKIRCSVETAKL